MFMDRVASDSDMLEAWSLGKRDERPRVRAWRAAPGNRRRSDKPDRLKPMLP